MIKKNDSEVLIISDMAVRELSRSAIDEDFIKYFDENKTDAHVFFVFINRCAYCLTGLEDEENSVVIIDLMMTELRDLVPNSIDPFERILTMVLSRLESTVSLSAKWGRFADESGRFHSFFAYTAAKGKSERIFYEVRAGEFDDIFVYNITNRAVEFQSVEIDGSVVGKARVKFEEAILNALDLRERDQSIEQDGAVSLSTAHESLGYVGTLDNWIKSRLTADQRRFVNTSYKRSVRLKGAAGTGKTLALIIKFLADLRSFEKDEADVRLLFLTHSQVTKERVVEVMSYLDPLNRITNGNFVIGRIGTVFEIAYELVQRREASIEPLDMDGFEGRKMQREIIESLVKERSVQELGHLYGDKCSSSFKGGLLNESSDAQMELARLLAHEFSFVLDADGVREGNEKGDRYRNGQIDLAHSITQNASDRKISLTIHRKFRDQLKEMRAISVDQMISDALGFLDSNAWDSMSPQVGYDALFVDELHLFTPLERGVLSGLLRDGKSENFQRPMFLAYDIRQKTKEYAFEDNDVPSWLRVQLPTELVELSEIFRYTDRIARCIGDIVEEAADPDALEAIASVELVAEREDEPKPVLWRYKTDIALYSNIFQMAKIDSKRIGGRKVAVIILDNDQFDIYRKAGKHKGDFVTVESDDELKNIRYAGKRFVLTTPEFVPGLQFDTVYVVHPDKSFLDDVRQGSFARKIGLRRLYTAATRAQRKLVFASSEEHGGPTGALISTIARGSLDDDGSLQG